MHATTMIDISRKNAVEASKTGDVDITLGLPKGFVHVPNSLCTPLRIARLCEKAGIPYGPAVVGMDKHGKGWKKRIDGVVIREKYRLPLLAKVEDHRVNKIVKADIAVLPHENLLKKLPERYKDPAASISDASKGMVILNRFCKNPECESWRRDEIYGLKSRFIKLLYQGGYAFSVLHLAKHFEKQKCKACYGTGYNDWGSRCPKCAGTGIWSEAKDIVFVVFSFRLNDEVYTWRLPSNAITYPYEITGQEEPVPEFLPIPASPHKTTIKELTVFVKWVVEQLEGHAKRPPTGENQEFENHMGKGARKSSPPRRQ